MIFDFSQVKTICVFGLKNNPARPAYYVSEYMQNHGFRIIPVNPEGESVLGERGYRSISDIPPEIEIDLADYFIRAEKVVPLVQEALDRGVKIHWLQQGIVNEEAARLVQEKGATIIMDKCIKVVHQNQKARG
ncbi:MAG: CoA-binding protein [Peptococcia bacterium]